MTTRAWNQEGLLGMAWTRGTMAGAQPRPDVPLSELADVELVRACVDGHREAFTVIVERHRTAVYRICFRFMANHEDASDLSQDVFLRAFRGLHRFRGESSFTTWLHRISVNVCLSRVGSKRPTSEPIDPARHVDGHDSPAEGLLRAERAARVREAVARLPNKQRAALVLRVYQDMSHQQVAETLGVTIGAAKANVFHALKNLKRLLSEAER